MRAKTSIPDNDAVCPTPDGVDVVVVVASLVTDEGALPFTTVSVVEETTVSAVEETTSCVLDDDEFVNSDRGDAQAAIQKPQEKRRSVFCLMERDVFTDSLRYCVLLLATSQKTSVTMANYCVISTSPMRRGVIHCVPHSPNDVNTGSNAAPFSVR